VGKLQEIFSNCTEKEVQPSDAVEELQSCKPTPQFLKSHFKELVVKNWLKQAEAHIKEPSPDFAATNVLIRIAESFDISDEDVEGYLVTRLTNLEYLECIEKNQVIEKEFEHQAEIDLNREEIIVWEFKNTAKNEQQRYSQDKQWTVLSSVLNNILIKKRYKDLAVKVEESGVLIVTNQSIYYKVRNDITQLKFSDIYSITPMKDGVRIQASTKGSMPDTYVTGDGRFTYTLLQYAKGLDV